MHFEAEHDFPAPPDRVADRLCDPAFHVQLDLPDLSRPEVVTSSVDGPIRLLRLRYEYTGQLDRIARKIVGNRKLTWVQELRLDLTTYTGTLTFTTDEDSDRFNGAAEVAIVAVDGNRSHRRIVGEFHIRVPLVGGTAEKKIVPGIVRRLDVEAAALAEALRAANP